MKTSTTSVQTSKAANFRPLLSSMSKEELRGVASALGVKLGKSNKDTITNLEKGIDEGKVHVKAALTISYKPEDGSATRKTYFGKTFRSYVSGPGHGDQVWLTPAGAVEGSPEDNES